MCMCCCIVHIVVVGRSILLLAPAVGPQTSDARARNDWPDSPMRRRGADVCVDVCVCMCIYIYIYIYIYTHTHTHIYAYVCTSAAHWAVRPIISSSRVGGLRADCGS